MADGDRRDRVSKGGALRVERLWLALFLRSDNWEMLVKVLDGCSLNDRFWVFAAATTDVGYTLRVTDTTTGSFKEWVNPLGNAADAITDTDALACP